jgi:acetate kinase
MSEPSILVLNSGSSSIKFSVFNIVGTEFDVSLRGQIEGIGTLHPRLVVKENEDSRERDLSEEEGGSHREAIAALAKAIATRSASMAIAAVGHRVVHGGDRYRAPTLIDEAALTYLATLNPLAPLHQPHNLAVIRAVLQELPDVSQVACFDTAFHQGHSAPVELFALPYAMYEAGIRRYGFHGLSYEYVATVLLDLLPAATRVIVAHLGNGASLCAMNGGRSIDSSMGFSGLDGLPMGTRCGQLDPGVILYLLQGRGMSVPQLEALLYKQSGLLGISGISADMRDLLGSAEARAKLAVDYFVLRVAREIAALTATLGGLDALVFTAGIGEHSPEVRRRICDRLGWLGIKLSEKANAAGKGCISDAMASVSAWVVPTNEELMIARHTRQLLAI